MANLQPRQHRRRRAAGAEPRPDRRGGRQGRRRDHLAGAEPAGRRPQRSALFVTGRVPIRRAGDGAAPVPGDGSHDWIGWASGDQLPHFVAPPAAGWSTPTSASRRRIFPVFLGRDWFGDWRARRIRELLDTLRQADRRPISPRMQVDVQSDLRAPAACRRCSPCRDRRRCPPRPGAAARLGRQHDDGRAAAADLQRLDGRISTAPCCAKPASRWRRQRPGARVRRLRAVAGGRALVRRRLHAAAASLAGRCARRR